MPYCSWRPVRICKYIVLNINIFNVEYHVIIEIVESRRIESSRVDKKIVESNMQISKYSPTPYHRPLRSYSIQKKFKKRWLFSLWGKQYDFPKLHFFSYLRAQWVVGTKSSTSSSMWWVYSETSCGFPFSLSYHFPSISLTKSPR